MFKGQNWSICPIINNHSGYYCVNVEMWPHFQNGIVYPQDFVSHWKMGSCITFGMGI